MHMASLVGTRVISLWGATHPYLGCLGWGQSIKDVLLPDRAKYPLLPSSTYGQKVFDGYEDAMRSIDPTDVITKVKEVVLSSQEAP